MNHGERNQIGMPGTEELSHYILEGVGSQSLQCCMPFKFTELV